MALMWLFCMPLIIAFRGPKTKVETKVMATADH